ITCPYCRYCWIFDPDEKIQPTRDGIRRENGSKTAGAKTKSCYTSEKRFSYCNGPSKRFAHFYYYGKRYCLGFHHSGYRRRISRQTCKRRNKNLRSKGKIYSFYRQSESSLDDA